MDLKSYKKEYSGQAKQENDKQKEALRKKAEEYTGKSDDDMLREIMKEAKKSKEKGSLSETQLEEFAKRVAPMLTEEQRERLENVLEMIKRS